MHISYNEKNCFGEINMKSLCSKKQKLVAEEDTHIIYIKEYSYYKYYSNSLKLSRLEKISKLKQSSDFLNKLDEISVSMIFQKFNLKSYKLGERVFSENDTCFKLYFILEGSFSLESEKNNYQLMVEQENCFTGLESVLNCNFVDELLKTKVSDRNLNKNTYFYNNRNSIKNGNNNNHVEGHINEGDKKCDGLEIVDNLCQENYYCRDINISPNQNKRKYLSQTTSKLYNKTTTKNNLKIGEKNFKNILENRDKQINIAYKNNVSRKKSIFLNEQSKQKKNKNQSLVKCNREKQSYNNNNLNYESNKVSSCLTTINDLEFKYSTLKDKSLFHFFYKFKINDNKYKNTLRCISNKALILELDLSKLSTKITLNDFIYSLAEIQINKEKAIQDKIEKISIMKKRSKLQYHSQVITEKISNCICKDEMNKIESLFEKNSSNTISNYNNEFNGYMLDNKSNNKSNAKIKYELKNKNKKFNKSSSNSDDNNYVQSIKNVGSSYKNNKDLDEQHKEKDNLYNSNNEKNSRKDKKLISHVHFNDTKIWDSNLNYNKINKFTSLIKDISERRDKDSIINNSDIPKNITDNKDSKNKNNINHLINTSLRKHFNRSSTTITKEINNLENKPSNNQTDNNTKTNTNNNVISTILSDFTNELNSIENNGITNSRKLSLLDNNKNKRNIITEMSMQHSYSVFDVSNFHSVKAKSGNIEIDINNDKQEIDYDIYKKQSPKKKLFKKRTLLLNTKLKIRSIGGFDKDIESSTLPLLKLGKNSINITTNKDINEIALSNINNNEVTNNDTANINITNNNSTNNIMINSSCFKPFIKNNICSNNNNIQISSAHTKNKSSNDFILSILEKINDSNKKIKEELIRKEQNLENILLEKKFLKNNNVSISNSTRLNSNRKSTHVSKNLSIGGYSNFGSTNKKGNIISDFYNANNWNGPYTTSNRDRKNKVGNSIIKNVFDEYSKRAYNNVNDINKNKTNHCNHINSNVNNIDTKSNNGIKEYNLLHKSIHCSNKRRFRNKSNLNTSLTIKKTNLGDSIMFMSEDDDDSLKNNNSKNNINNFTNSNSNYSNTKTMSHKKNNKIFINPFNNNNNYIRNDNIVLNNQWKDNDNKFVAKKPVIIEISNSNYNNTMEMTNIMNFSLSTKNDTNKSNYLGVYSKKNTDINDFKNISEFDVTGNKINYNSGKFKLPFLSKIKNNNDFDKYQS